VSEPEDKPPGSGPTDTSPPGGIPVKTGAEIEVQTGPVVAGPVIEIVAAAATDAEAAEEEKARAEVTAMEKVVAAAVVEAVAAEPPARTVHPVHPLRRYLRGQARGPLEIIVVIALALALLVPGIGNYSFVDPWETHYSEVSRRMLQDDDLVHTKWQNEGFRSKPVLTFWMIAGGLRSFGFAADGGYSGEMVSSPWVMFAARLPFVLFGVLGLCVLWWALARLANRQVAWLAFLILGTTPFYFFVARQAITDIPMVGSLIAAMSLLAMALHAPEERLARLHPRVPITAYHLFLGAFALFLGWQAIYYARYFWDSPQLAQGVRFYWPHIVIPAAMLLAIGTLVLRWTLFNQLLAAGFMMVLGIAGAVIGYLSGGGLEPPIVQGLLIGELVGYVAGAALVYVGWPRWDPARWWWSPVTTNRQLYMCWFYFLLGISVLAKGLPAIGIAGAVAFFYILLTNSWRRLAELEIPRGAHIVFWVVVPWHLAMYLKDGRPFVRDYIFTHNLKRATAGVHGERGTFDFFIQQLGIGMWPWIALVPAAVAHVATRLSPATREGRVRLLFGVWAVVSMALFSLSETKFHHYVLPVVPALVVLIAFWLDDLMEGDGGRTVLLLLAGAGAVVLIGIDLLGEQKQFIELFVYRYDRAWPADVDLTPTLRVFAAGFTALLVLLMVPWIRRWTVAALLAAGLAFALWGMHVYMKHAGTHWGMRTAVQTYYQERQIYGVDIRYYGLRQLADEWDGSDGLYRVDSYMPDQFAAGLPMTIEIQTMRTTAQPDRTIRLDGIVASYDDTGFWIVLYQGELDKLAPLIAQGKTQDHPGRRPWHQVNADRLIAWQLYWRGENFWSGDEIWSESPDTKTAFKNTDNKEFLDYLADESRAGQRFYVITEAGRAQGLKNILPTRRSKDTFQILDTSSNKFTLLTFTL
jgi:4-amino-4-deoxy-L-arabinose transferase-like glycosyltransferase